jgi:hypothetical protein
MPQPPYTDTPDPAGVRQPAHLPGSDTPRLRTYRQLIGGIWSDAAGGEWLESLNPANGAAWALIPRGRAIDAERAVAAARAAFESATWRAMRPAPEASCCAGSPPTWRAISRNWR